MVQVPASRPNQSSPYNPHTNFDWQYLRQKFSMCLVFWAHFEAFEQTLQLHLTHPAENPEMTLAGVCTTVCLLGRWHIWFKHLMCDDFIFCFYCAENCYTVCFSVIKLNNIYIVIFYISKVVGKVTARHMQRQTMALPMRRLTSRTSTLYTFTVPIPGVSWKLFYVWAKYFVEYPRTKFSI